MKRASHLRGAFWSSQKLFCGPNPILSEVPAVPVFGSSSWALNGGCQSTPPCSDGAAARLPVPYSSQQLQLLLPSVPTQLCTAVAGTHRK